MLLMANCPKIVIGKLPPPEGNGASYANPNVSRELHIQKANLCSSVNFQ